MQINHADLSDGVLSPADLLGRAFRICRSNWRVVLRHYVLPSFLNCYYFTYLYWLEDHFFYNHILIVGGTVVALVFMLLGEYEAGRISYAIFETINNPGESLPSALEATKQKRMQILVVVLPMVLADLLVGVTIIAGGAFRNMAKLENIRAAAFVALIIAIVVAISQIPYGMLGSLSSAFMANLVAEKLTIRACLKRFFYLITRSPGYVLAFLLVQVIVSYSWQFATLFIEFLDLVPQLFPKNKEVVAFIMVPVQTAVQAPFTAYVWGVMAIAGACLHYQLCLRKEGTDIKQQLARFRASQ